MKTVKINFVGFWPGFDPENFFLTGILRKHYRVEITEDADYVICSGFNFYEYLGSEQVRIFFSGENYIPDFNFVDYAITVYPIEFLDRHFSFPGLVLNSFDFLKETAALDRNYRKSILDGKPYFMNMIASHESEHGLRGEIVRRLSQYRRVEAAGTYLNNMPDGKAVSMSDGSKTMLQKKCKFTFCGESIAHEGFVTEKIFDAFRADTIPIYYGSSTVSSIINKDAYIDIRDYDSLDQVVERIIELDSDDEKYLQMLRQPIFANADYVERIITELEKFICHIFDQPAEKAYRRSRSYMPIKYEEEIMHQKKASKDLLYSLRTTVYQKKEEIVYGVRDLLKR